MAIDAPAQPSSTRLTVQPLTAKAVVDSVRRPSDLAPLVRIDPTLAATVLRLANSAHYGWSGRVTNAPQACNLLGTRTVQAVSANGTASLLFGTGRESTRSGFWSHSLHTRWRAPRSPRRRACRRRMRSPSACCTTSARS